MLTAFRYSYYDDLHFRLEACRMGAALLQGCFGVSLMHPQRLLDFATYTPQLLWDNVNIFDDPYRCSLADVMSGLETIATVLVDSGMVLPALPVIALWEHTASHKARSVSGTVLCRTIRARALIHLGLMAEAASVLLGLMSGSKLPSRMLDSDLVVKGSDGVALQIPALPTFSNALPPSHADNQACMDYISDVAVPPPLVELYGPWLTAQLAIARAGFLVQLGSVRDCWKLTDKATGEAGSRIDNARLHCSMWTFATCHMSLQSYVACCVCNF